MFNHVSHLLHYEGSSSYSLSCVSPQENPCGIIHVQKHDNRVLESNIWTNRSGHNSIGSSLGDGGIHHGHSPRTASTPIVVAS